MKKVSKKIVETIGTVCISGRLNSYPTKAAATEVLEQHGYVVKSSLTKDCTHLINESGIESAKTQAARERGVVIVTNLNNFFNWRIKMALPKWTDERTSALESFVGSESPVSQATVANAAEELETSVRSVSSQTQKDGL